MRKNIYMYIRWRNFFFLYSVKLEKKVKKINFINLFSYEEKKIIFKDFTSSKMEENGVK